MSENFSRFLEPSNHPNYKWQKSLHQNWQSLISCPQLSLNLQPVAWATFSIFCVFWCNHSTTCYKNYLWKGKLFSILRIDTRTPAYHKCCCFFCPASFFHDSVWYLDEFFPWRCIWQEHQLCGTWDLWNCCSSKINSRFIIVLCVLSL